MEMLSVSEAEDIIRSNHKDFGVESVGLMEALGRVLAEDLLADRDLPPFNRATVDGIAIHNGSTKHGKGIFKVMGVQAAGETPLSVSNADQCIEIMTGAAVDTSFDAVIRYEDCTIENGMALVGQDVTITAGMNIHKKGKDKQMGDLVADKNRVITASVIGLATSIGKTALLVKKLPLIAVISTGDELVAVDQLPSPYQLRRSNDVVIKATLEKYSVPVDLYHLNDHPDEISRALHDFLKTYDVLIMTGGVSMGKFDYVPMVLEQLGVVKQLHKVRQRPGKPFWFGKNEAKKLVFAFPGNPVSAFLCLNRYFVPWLRGSLGLNQPDYLMAILSRDIYFKPTMQYFVQVELAINEEGILTATPFETNGSGDFSNLVYASGFMELPAEQEVFKKGERFKVWRYDFCGI